MGKTSRVKAIEYVSNLYGCSSGDAAALIEGLKSYTTFKSMSDSLHIFDKFSNIENAYADIKCLLLRGMPFEHCDFSPTRTVNPKAIDSLGTQDTAYVLDVDAGCIANAEPESASKKGRHFNTVIARLTERLIRDAWEYLGQEWGDTRIIAKIARPHELIDAVCYAFEGMCIDLDMTMPPHLHGSMMLELLDTENNTLASIDINSETITYPREKDRTSVEYLLRQVWEHLGEPWPSWDIIFTVEVSEDNEVEVQRIFNREREEETPHLCQLRGSKDIINLNDSDGSLVATIHTDTGEIICAEGYRKGRKGETENPQLVARIIDGLKLAWAYTCEEFKERGDFERLTMSYRTWEKLTAGDLLKISSKAEERIGTSHGMFNDHISVKFPGNTVVITVDFKTLDLFTFHQEKPRETPTATSEPADVAPKPPKAYKVSPTGMQQIVKAHAALLQENSDLKKMIARLAGAPTYNPSMAALQGLFEVTE